MSLKIHKITSLCPICGKISDYGSSDMEKHKTKYNCPSCGSVHYGEPETNDGSFVCYGCQQSFPENEWGTSDLAEGEIIRGPITACNVCLEKLGDEHIAIIEVENNTKDKRTGRVFFAIPPPETAAALGEERAIFMTLDAIKEIINEEGVTCEKCNRD